MRGKPKPQISQMGADGFFNSSICGNLCHLWFNCFLAMEKDLKRRGGKP